MLVSIIIFILVGACAGWLAGTIFKGGGFGFWINVLVGIVGGLLGGWLIGGLIPPIVSLGVVTLGGLITAVIGAIILLWIISLIKKK